MNATSITTATGQGFKVAFGTASYTISGSFPANTELVGSTISFGYTFTSPPTVFVTPNSYGGNTGMMFLTAGTNIATTTTGFTPYIVNVSSVFTPTGTFTFNWLALGI